MKKYLSVLFALLLILSTALWIVSCKDEPDGPDEPDEPMVDIVKDGVSQWRLVRSDTAATDSGEVTAAKALRAAVLKATGCSLKFVTDYEDDDNGQMYEILVGNTVRAEDDEIGALAVDEFVITFIGNKLLIKGGSDTALIRAVEYFIATYLGQAAEGTRMDLRLPEGLNQLDNYYNVLGEDVLNVFGLSDEDYELLEELSYTYVEPSDVSDGYDIHEDGGLIYDPISREKADQLSKYDDSETVSGTLETTVNGVTYTLTYEIPKAFTAYDAVPIRYTITASGSSGTAIHVSATGFDDPAKEGDELYYDLNLPGKIDLDWEYLGYVAATDDLSNRPVVTADSDTDSAGEQFPQYETEELVRSGTVMEHDYVYFKFRYTNTGNTILDSNGNSDFRVKPVVYRRNADGQYEEYAIHPNGYACIFEDVYPGDSGEMWFTFTHDHLGVGEYKIVLYGLASYEHSDLSTAGMAYGKEGDATVSEYYFTVSNAEETVITEPEAVKKISVADPRRNGWLHTYQEFMSSFDSHLKGISAGETIQETMYLQSPPWCEQVVLRLMVGNGDNMVAVAIPVEIETDSIVVNFNPDNNNYVVLDDGTRFPAITTQSMAGMRVGVKDSPYGDQDIINDFLDMKESGINLIQTDSGAAVDPSAGASRQDGLDGFWFQLDVARLLEMRVMGWLTYPYHTKDNAVNANLLFGTELEVSAAFGDANMSTAHGLLANWRYQRWGDNYWVAGQDTVVIDAEDLRGWLRWDFNARDVMSEDSKQNFRYFLADLYDCDIDALNADWGTDYTCFGEIDPEKGTTADHEMRSYKSDDIVFSEWSRPLELLDQFRTLERLNDYKRILEVMKETMPTAKFAIRTECTAWPAAVGADTDNTHYRYVYYSQQRDATIPELLSNSGIVYSLCQYSVTPFTPSEVAELTRMSVEGGVVPIMLAKFDCMQDIAINDKYGRDYTYDFNLETQTRGATVDTMCSLFEWWRATYENGGVPGVLWQDYIGVGVVTSVQRKEMAFFTEKLTEALNTPEGREWATNFTQDTSVLDGSEGLYTYDKEFLQDAIDEAMANRK